MKHFVKIATIATICLSMNLLTACGGSSKKKNVTTLSCTNTSITNNNGVTWQVSQSDTRRCNPLSTIGNCRSGVIRVPSNGQNNNNRINCPVGTNGRQNCSVNNGYNNNNNGYNNGYNNNGYNNSNNGQFGQPYNGGFNGGSLGFSASFDFNIGGSIGTGDYDSDYHRYPGQYFEQCLDQYRNGGSQYIVNAGSYYYLDYNSFQYDYVNSYRTHGNINRTNRDFGDFARGAIVGAGLVLILQNL